MKKFVLDLGGSIVAPEKFDTEFLQKMRSLLLRHITDSQFFVVIGGGYVCRKYLQGAKSVTSLEPSDLDWLGIQATRLNAKFFQTIIGDAACSEIFLDPNEMPKTDKKIIVGGGWEPGNSTDYVATVIAKNQQVDTLVVLTNVTHVYDKDPNKFDDAEQFDDMTWSELKAIIGDEWIPGAKLPLDPLACQLAEKAGLKVVVMHGENIDNFEKFLNGEDFVGTTIS
ncbi:UMP kinase [Candidatus Kuenenbacteria bacterium]|nr:UMP kinase [Candidatus Kuenenbacteria bacterium]